MGTLVVNTSKTTEQAGGLFILTTFLLVPLGGCWVFLEITPKAFQSLAQVLPTTWAMRRFMDVIACGQGPQGALLEILVLLGFAVLFFIRGLWRFCLE